MLKSLFFRKTRKQMFCEKYWQNISTNTQKAPNVDTFDFYDASLEIMGLNNLYSNLGSLGHLVKRNDLELRLDAIHTDTDMVLWRGIENPLEEFNAEIEKRSKLGEGFK